MLRSFFICAVVAALVPGNFAELNLVQGTNTKQSSTTECLVTRTEMYAWWAVDLGAVQPVKKIVIKTLDGLSDALINAQVRVIDGRVAADLSTFEAVIRDETVATITHCGPVDIDLDQPVYGNIVVIQHVAKEPKTLALCNVDVFAECDAPSGDIALRKTAQQSSTYGKAFEAGNAVNGVPPITTSTSGRCAHTGRMNSPWWSVNLGGMYPISEIRIKNRNDCCQDRLIGAVVRVMDFNTDNPNTADSPKRMFEVGRITKQNYKTRDFIVFQPDTPIYGNFVTVTLDGKTNYLSLCTVEVYASCPATISSRNLEEKFERFLDEMFE